MDKIKRGELCFFGSKRVFVGERERGGGGGGVICV